MADTQHGNANCHNAECHIYCYAECRYAECRYTECRGAPFEVLSLIGKSLFCSDTLADSVMATGRQCYKAFFPHRHPLSGRIS